MRMSSRTFSYRVCAAEMVRIPMIKRLTTILAAFVASSGLTAPALTARQVDVYILYDSSDRDAKNELVGALPEGMSTKSYNSNLLALADYSGKQRTLSKLERASVVVILSDATLDHLSGRLADAIVLLVNTISTGLTSDRQTIHVLDSGTDVGALGGNMTAINASGEADLADRTRVEAANIIFVNVGTLTTSRTLSLIIQRLLGRQP